MRGIDRLRIEHIYDIREAIESMLTRRFCERASASSIDRLAAIQLRHDETSMRLDASATSAVNFEFHHLIHSHAGNPEALALVERYTEFGHSLHRRFHGDHAGFERARTEHHMRINAFRARDVEAAGMISRIHVSGTRLALLSRIDGLDHSLVPEHLRSGGGSTADDHRGSISQPSGRK